MDAATKISADIGPALSEDQLLMDVCSLKEFILKEMLRSTSAQVAGTHPLFGPFTGSMKKQNIIICPGRGSEWLGWLEKEFTSKGAVVTRMDAAAHDRNMAVVQGLTHFITVCTGRVLQKLNMSPDEARTCSTPIFKLKLDLVGRLFAQDLHLYQKLIGGNAYSKDVLDMFSAVAEEAKEMLLSGQNDTGTGYLEDIRRFLGDFCKDALEESNEVLNGLYPE
jgi:prephenate dehydrogenase